MVLALKKQSHFFIQIAKKFNIDLNLRDNDGITPFHLACFHGKWKTVEKLLKISKKHKINVFSVGNDGNDGQDYAEQKGHTDVAKLIKAWKRMQSNEELTNHIHDEILFQLEQTEQSEDPKIANAIKLIKVLKEDTFKYK